MFAQRKEDESGVEMVRGNKASRSMKFCFLNSRDMLLNHVLLFVYKSVGNNA